MTKADELERVKAQILSKKICDDLAKSATQLVFGDGNPDSEVVFIGEAPGKNEDLQGLPFVGAAGKFLNEMLEGIGLKRDDVYITNIVKYRPPNNRDPLPEEKAAFLPYLRAQLATIKPKLIVTLGRHSLETLIPGLRISDCHGKPKRIKVRLPGDTGMSTIQGAGEQQTELYRKYSKGVAEPATKKRTISSDRVVGSADKQADTSWVILPLFHPAAALYNGGMRSTLVDDFNKIPRILAAIK